MRIEYWEKWYGVTHWLKMVWPMRVEYWWEKVVLIVSYVENQLCEKDKMYNNNYVTLSVQIL